MGSGGSRTKAMTGSAHEGMEVKTGTVTELGA